MSQKFNVKSLKAFQVQTAEQIFTEEILSRGYLSTAGLERAQRIFQSADKNFCFGARVLRLPRNADYDQQEIRDRFDSAKKSQRL